MTQIAIECSDQLASEGIKVGVLHMHTIKPIDHKKLKELIPQVKKVITLEEHIRVNGLGTAILEFCNDNIPSETSKIYRIGLPNKFVEKYGNQSILLDHFQINKSSIINIIKKLLISKLPSSISSFFYVFKHFVSSCS